MTYEEMLQSAHYICGRCESGWTGATKDGKCPHCDYAGVYRDPPEEPDPRWTLEEVEQFMACQGREAKLSQARLI